MPKQRLALQQRIEGDLLQDKRIIGVFYGGSIGTKTTDIYSDIDVRIVVSDEHYERYRLAKRVRAKCWGDVLFFEDLPCTNYSVAHYDSFLKVDSFYYRTRDLVASVWLQNVKVLLDRGGFLHELVAESRKLRYEPSVEEVIVLRTKFLAHSHEVYRRARRGEWNYALNCLNYLRMIVVTAWCMDKRIQPNTLGDWAKYEGARSQLDEWQLVFLAEWDGRRDAEDMLSKVRMMFDEFKTVHRSLCACVGIDEESEMMDRVMGMVV
ncbi:nucleotidyltransferase domain-containing protein [Alkalihalobacillus sp. FSL W8-0930]